MDVELPQFGLVVVGHVDHGKSTLIGRLLHDTGSLPDGKAEEVRATSAKRGMPVEWSFVLDALQAERDQAITIDTTRIWFRTASRRYVIIDAPGHREFLRNMISGAAEAEAAVLVVDAAEGLRDQTRRHAYLLHLLGIRQVVVVVNKMDLCGFSESRFAAVREDVGSYLRRVGLEPLAVVPVVARDGDNLTARSGRMPWYQGPSLLEQLDALLPSPGRADRPLRLPIQDIYKFDERRILVGRVEAGTFRAGDTLLFSPSNRSARVASIESWGPGVPPDEARAGDAVGFTLDDAIFVERGDIASHVDRPPVLSTAFRCRLFWLGEKPLTAGRSLRLKLTTNEARVTVEAIDRVIDTETLEPVARSEVRRNDMATVSLRGRELLAFDPYGESPATGRCVLLDGFDVVAGGVIERDGFTDRRPAVQRRSSDLYRVDHLLTPESRAIRNGHSGAVVWLTGLSGAGKSTLAMQVERELFTRGYSVYVLDGDNVRRGLNADLGFTPEARAENIRRVGEVAALFADAGIVVITAFISPYRADREGARAAAPGQFHEVYVRADLATCERRDPKGLYRRARAGAVREFTGISAPYEEPEHPELVVDTAENSLEACVDALVGYVIARTTAMG